MPGIIGIKELADKTGNKKAVGFGAELYHSSIEFDGRVLLAERKQAGLTLKQLAERIEKVSGGAKVHYRNLSKYERCEQDPSCNVLALIAQALRRPIGSFYKVTCPRPKGALAETIKDNTITYPAAII
jgi:transcriptional regulator with XRE-family HTH domain